MNRWVRTGLITVGVLVITTVGGFGALAVRFTSRMDTHYDVKGSDLEVSTSSEAIERGAHLAHIFGCRSCHGDGLEGHVVLDEKPLGRMTATNLTHGKNGVAGAYTSPALWDRAIRNGIGADGKPLVMMPSLDYVYLSDEETADIIAYVQSVPSKDSDLPPTDLMLAAKLLDELDLLKVNNARRIDHAAERPDAPPAGVTVEYGRHLARGCVGCHGDGYSGGPIPGAPPSMPVPRNLTPDATGLAAWSEADLIRALREGLRPDGSKIDPFMPIDSTKHMTDDELRAVHVFLKSLPPTPFGKR